MHYKVTILNSPAVNAFALPTGQLYITRGLLALANDNSEIASVLSHEMAHVIARHAAIREDQIRQAAILNRVASDVIGDPQMGALALAKSKIALATFSRGQEFEADGIGVGISSRAGFDPYGATRFLTSMGRSSELRSGNSKTDTRTMEFLSSHPATPERVANATLNARQYSAPGPGRANARNMSACSTAWFMARTRAKASCADGGSCIRSSASPSPRRMASCSRTRRRRCSASATAANRRCGSMSCASPPTRS